MKSKLIESKPCTCGKGYMRPSTAKLEDNQAQIIWQCSYCMKIQKVTREEILSWVLKYLGKHVSDLPEEYAKLVNEHFWELI